MTEREYERRLKIQHTLVKFVKCVDILKISGYIIIIEKNHISIKIDNIKLSISV